MKIINLSVEKKDNDGDPALVCTITYDDGSQNYCAFPWRNTLGLWASSENERDPAEICAALRCFARAIEQDEKAAA